MSNQNNHNTISLLEQALSYAGRGWSVIPTGPDKKPLVQWKKFQKERADEDQLRKWFAKYPDLNIAIVTGPISGLDVIDIDPRHKGTDEAFKDISTVCAKTGGGGFHYYFKHLDGVQNGTNIQQGIDVRGEGGFVIAPPSGHPSGGTYEWIKGPDDIELAELPRFVHDWIAKPSKADKSKKSDDASYLNGVSEGNRNDAAAKTAGKLLQKFPSDEAWPFLCAWNSTNMPPLPQDELKTVFDSIKAREEESSEDSSHGSLAEDVVKAILASNILLFHDQYKKGHISLSGDGREVFGFKSDHFKSWLAGYIWDNFGKPTSSDAISKISLILESKAMFHGEMFHLEARICWYKDAIWYDIGDGSAVRIDEQGYSLIQNPPILFRRFGHQSKQVVPLQGGDIKDLADFVNVTSKQERLLFLVFTIASFIPGFPHPLLVLFGPQGAGKSTPLRMLKMLIDPSQLKTLSMSDSEREFVQMASHHYFLFFDNLSGLPTWMSDALARASTGDGFSKRELYSDDNDVIYSFQRTIGLNGINLVVEKPDLLDRSILLGLQRIAKDKRMGEKKFWASFDKKRAYLLGAIFQVVSKAIRIRPTIHLDELPRMADFALWGCAIAEAMGHSSQEFMDAYDANIHSQNDAALEASPVGTAVIAFMEEKKGDWEGTASDLLEILDKTAVDMKIGIRQKLWPKDAAWLVKRLNTIVPNLEEAGIKYERLETHRPKVIRLTRVALDTDATVLPSGNIGKDHSDSTNNSVGSAVGNGENILPTDGMNGLSQQSTSVKSVRTVDNANYLAVEDLEQVKSEEELSKLTPVEREIYVEKFWNTTEKELEQLAAQKINSSPPHK